MRPSGSVALVLALLAAGSPLHAQESSRAVAPGTIHGAAGRSGAGEIHVVGQTRGSQQIHFTDAFKVEPSSSLHAVLSTGMTVDQGAADLGAIASAGDQLIAVPPTVDVGAYAVLLVYDTRSKTVVASAILPNAKGKSYSEKRDSTMPQTY
jgi:hypothetical protein